ncbi:MAG: glycosyltransferase family 2 protein [Robiginitomaculum sp.]|nr:glycosyltransferase family 2 protein [Robiginitomaculum sp.]
MARDIKNGVSIIVPTFRRPDGLKTALVSLMDQTANDLALEIIVADNDPKGSARDYVENFAKTAAIKTHYLHVPAPGVSNARNGALGAAQGRYLAFLDDDQQACTGWLQTLLNISKKYEAALAFVPTHARIPGSSKFNDYLVDFFSRQGPDLTEGIVDDFFGCGNSLLDTGLCTLPAPPFSIDMNETGGEDDLLFSELKSQGIKIAWSRAANANEDILPHRATPEYVKVRSFANGQSPSQECADTKNWLGVAKWMLVGAVQYALYTPMALLTKLTNKPSYIHYLAKSASGKGKVLWFGNFTPKLYGAAVIENTAF